LSSKSTVRLRLANPIRAALAGLVDAGVPSDPAARAASVRRARLVTECQACPGWVAGIWAAAAAEWAPPARVLAPRDGCSCNICRPVESSSTVEPRYCIPPPEVERYALALSASRAWLTGWSGAAWRQAAQWNCTPLDPAPRFVYPLQLPSSDDLPGWIPPRHIVPVDYRPTRATYNARPHIWWRRQCDRTRECGNSTVLLARPAAGGEILAAPYRCGARACRSCSCKSMRAAVMRYTSMWALPLRRSHGLRFVTIGSRERVGTHDELAEWRKGIAKVQAAMRRGVGDCGVPAGAWVGGVTVVEVEPRPAGVYVHAHICMLARRYYPYGQSASTWREWAIRAGVELPPRTSRGWTPAALAHIVPPSQVRASESAYDAAARHLGVREVQRRCGVGEVHDRRAMDGGAADYVSKVQKYVSKVQKRDSDAAAKHSVAAKVDRVTLTNAGARVAFVRRGVFRADVRGFVLPHGAVGLSARPDLLHVLRGSRRIQPWGCMRGWHASPTQRWVEVGGRRDPRVWVGRQAGPPPPASRGPGARVTTHSLSWPAVRAVGARVIDVVAMVQWCRARRDGCAPAQRLQCSNDEAQPPNMGSMGPPAPDNTGRAYAGPAPPAAPAGDHGARVGIGAAWAG
jgi:hypothetical protein